MKILYKYRNVKRLQKTNIEPNERKKIKCLRLTDWADWLID